MPNWVDNTLTVSGEASEVARFVETAGRPYETRFCGDFIENADGTKTYDEDLVRVSRRESELSFWNFAKPENEEDYFDQGWYDWNLTSWGCKWDASDVETQDYSDDEKAFTFSTPWSPPVEAFEKMCAMFPTLNLHLSYEEEQGWGGEYSSDGKGGAVETDSYDIPASHADYEARSATHNCICTWDDDQDYWFSDCPKN